MKHLSLIAALGLSASLLSGCFSDSDDDDIAVETPVVIAPQPEPDPGTGNDGGQPTLVVGTEADFGAGFAAAFRADPLDEPTDPMDGDIVALDKTIDPFDIENPAN